jgi:hypothetical protein
MESKQCPLQNAGEFENAENQFSAMLRVMNNLLNVITAVLDVFPPVLN